MERRRKNEKFRFFEPNGKQAEAIAKVGTEGDIISILSAANGVGKTTLVVNILASLIWGAQSDFFAFPLFESWPYPKRVRYITDPNLVKDIGPFHSEIEKWWPKGKYVAEKAGSNYFSQYKANGWVIDVMTYDQNIRQFEGGTMGLVVADEPPPRDIWNASIFRLRLGGILLCVMTPLTHAGWFFDEVAPKHQDSMIFATIEDNCKEHGIRGQLDHEFIQKMIAEIPADEVQARAYGKALSLEGLIYKTFNPAVHVLKHDMPTPKTAQLYNIVDPHTDKPFASIWGFPDQNGDVYITDEWPNEDFGKMHNCQLDIKDYKKIFRDKEQGLSIHKRIIDRHFADVRSAATKRTLRDELADIGLDYESSYTASEEIETGILKVRSYLNYNPTKEITSINRPKLYINPKCLNTIKSFQRWSRNQKNGKVNDDRWKDFMDVVRMFLMDDPKVDIPAPPQVFKKLYG